MMNASRGRGDRFLIISFCALTFFIIAMAGLTMWHRTHWREKAEEKVRELAAAGFATTHEELRRRGAEKVTGKNAAEIYRQAFGRDMTAAGRDAELLPIIGRGSLPVEGEPMSAEMFRAVEEFLELNAEALRLYREAANIETCWFGSELDAEGNVDWQHLAGMRNGARLLRLLAAYELEEGRPDHAAAAHCSLLRMERHLREADSYLIPFLTSLAIRSIALNGLALLLESDVSEEALAALQAELDGVDDEFMLASAMEAELTFGIAMFEEALTMGGGFDWSDWAEPEMWALQLYSMVGQPERDRWNYLNLIESYIMTLREPMHLRPTPSAGPAPASDEIDWRAMLHGRRLTERVAGSFERLFESERRSSAQLRVALAATAVARYRMEEGRYPAQLEDLSPYVAEARWLINPIANKWLDYRLEDESFTISSGGHASMTVRRRDAQD